MKHLMCRFMKKRVLNESTLAQLVDMDVTNPEFHKKIRKIDPGFTAEAMLNHLVNHYEVDKKTATKFHQQYNARTSYWKSMKDC